MKLLLLVAVSLALTLPAAHAANLPDPGSGTITLDQVAPAYQDQITFTTTGLGKLKNPRVWVACYQGADLVYGEGGGADDVFVLGGGSSQWVTNGGGAADCYAQLYYIKKANGNAEWSGSGLQEFVFLASTSFHADA